MKINQLFEEKREEIRRTAAKDGAMNVRMFGSVARGETRQDFDLDLLVDTGPETSSWFSRRAGPGPGGDSWMQS